MCEAGLAAEAKSPQVTGKRRRQELRVRDLGKLPRWKGAVAVDVAGVYGRCRRDGGGAL